MARKRGRGKGSVRIVPMVPSASGFHDRQNSVFPSSARGTSSGLTISAGNRKKPPSRRQASGSTSGTGTEPLGQRASRTPPQTDKSSNAVDPIISHWRAVASAGLERGARRHSNRDSRPIAPNINWARRILGSPRTRRDGCATPQTERSRLRDPYTEPAGQYTRRSLQADDRPETPAALRSLGRSTPAGS